MRKRSTKVVVRAVGVVLLAGSLLAACGDDDGGSATLDDAVAVAQRSMPLEMPDRQVGDMVQGMCEAARTGRPDAMADDLGSMPWRDDNQLGDAVSAIGDGAHARCPADMADAPHMMDEAFDAARAMRHRQRGATTTAPGAATPAPTPSTPTTGAPSPSMPMGPGPNGTMGPGTGSPDDGCTWGGHGMGGRGPMHGGDGYRCAR